MLRRGVCVIARKSSITGRTLSSSSCINRSVTYANETLTAASFRQICNIRTEKKQTFRRISHTPNWSSESDDMDGQGDHKVCTVNYDALINAQKKGDLIIDVREHSEINETGKLPGSIHIPMRNINNELQTLSDEVFEKKFGKPKPEKDTKIIVSCRSGIRSRKVQEQLQRLGYKNVYNYSGGWLDWKSRQHC